MVGIGGLAGVLFFSFWSPYTKGGGNVPCSLEKPSLLLSIWRSLFRTGIVA